MGIMWVEAAWVGWLWYVFISSNVSVRYWGVLNLVMQYSFFRFLLSLRSDNFIQPSSIYSCLWLVWLLQSVTIWAASSWIFRIWEGPWKCSTHYRGIMKFKSSWNISNCPYPQHLLTTPLPSRISCIFYI